MNFKNIGFIFLFGFLSFSINRNAGEISDDMAVSDLLESLGEDLSKKKPDYSVSNVSAEIGEDIVKHGFSSIKGLKKSHRQSKHFNCTSCHNIVQEDPVLNINNAQDRLVYTQKKGIPYLQATTLWGAVNRQSYYNGDYEKKYGELVRPARKNIREAIQLCATECAQGRKLKDWELESVLAYLWEIQLKVKDLKLSEREKTSVKMALENEKIQKEARKLLKTKYSLTSGATFVPPPADRKLGTGLIGNRDNGKLLYDQSCLHCHYHKKYSFLNLDNEKMSFKHLNKKASSYDRHSIYQVVRFGTYSKYGKKSYMPLYTYEKMTDQQLADLRTYIEYRASL